MKFSILHSSNRPDQYRAAFDAWIAAADDPELVEYILVVDRGGPFKELPKLRHHDVVAWNDRRRCCIDGQNLAATLAAGEFLICNADDQFPAPHWDTFLAEQIATATHVDRSEMVLWAATGTPNEFERKLVIMPIVARARVKRLGYLFYPTYEGMFADNDLYEHASHDGVLVKLSGDVVFPHRHPLFDPSAGWDDTYAKQNSARSYQLGAAVLSARRECSFGIPNNTAELSVLHRKTIAVCLPGNIFSSQWVAQWTSLYGELLARFDVRPIFVTSSDVQQVRNILAREIQSVGADYALWIDDDNPVSWGHVEQLLADLDANPDVSLVAGWAWCQPDDVEAEARLSVGRLPRRFEADTKEFYNGVKCLDYLEMMRSGDDLQPIGYTGFPIVLMRAGLLISMPDNPFVGIPTLHHPFGAWPEDISFGIRARDRRLMVDRRVHVPHMKRRAATPTNLAQLQAELVNKLEEVPR